MWVSDKKPTSATQAGQMADNYKRARKDIPSAGKDTSRGPLDRRRCNNCGREGHQTKDCYSLSPGSKGEVSQHDIKCLNCGLLGHSAAKCRKTTHQGKEFVGWSSHNGMYRAGVVEGTKVDDMLLDTGAARTIVHSRLVPSRKLTGKKVLIWSVHGDAVSYPLAQINIQVGGSSYYVEAAVANTTSQFLSCWVGTCPIWYAHQAIRKRRSFM